MRLDGGAWLACFVRHIPRARLPPENVEGAEDPNLATSSLPHLAYRTGHQTVALAQHARTVARSPSHRVFGLRHNPRPDRDHARVRQEFALRETAPLASSIPRTWHKPPPRFSQGPPSALHPTLLSDRCEPPTTTPCVPSLIAPHHARRCLFRVALRQAALQIHAARNAQECTFAPKVSVCLRSS